MLHDLYYRVRALLRRQSAETELEEELRFHWERQVEKYVAAGKGREEAQRLARFGFGGVEQVKEECRDARGLSWLETFWQDTRYAARMFRRSPGFTAVAVLTLALGIGANTAIFSVLDGVLLKPLSYPHPERLVSIDLTPLALNRSVRGMAPEDYFVFREQSRTFQDIGIYASTDTDRDVNVTGFAEPERVHALRATSEVLSLLGTAPFLGRIFSRQDDSPASAPTVVLTHDYWETKFRGDRSAIGKTIIVDGEAREIIGVLPRDFRFLDLQGLAMVLPLQMDPVKTRLGSFTYFGIARLKEGSTIAQASADVERMVPMTFTSFPPGPGLSVDLLRKARLSPSILPLKEEVVGNIATLLWVLMGGVGIVLLIACTNVANLLLVRTTGRRHELALRAALGASRRRIAAQLLRESAVLGLMGGIVGLGLTAGTLRLLVRMAPEGLPRMDQIGLDLRALAFALVIALFTSLLFGLIPVARHAGIAGSIPSSGRTLTSGREHHRVQAVLVAVQVALALVLLVCSGLMIRTFRMLSRVDPGFRAADVQTFRISIPATDVADNSMVTRIEQQVQDKLAAIPGVSAVAFSSAVPMDGNETGVDNVFAADHAAEEQGAVPPFRRILFVSPGYAGTMGVPFLAGRDFTWAETYNQLPVALISESFAREYWGTPAAALGQRIRPSASSDWREIIGVVGDVRDEAVEKPARTTVYWPVVMANYNGRVRVSRYASFVVRSPLAGSEDFMRQVRQAVWSVNAKIPLASVRTLSYFYTRSMARTSFTLVMLGIAAGMALLLGTVGLYGVIAYSVSQRTREIGIRMALGAQPRKILALIVGRGMAIIAAGLGVGVLAALLLTQFLSSMLFGVHPQDPLTYAIVVVALASVALAACYLPARRAARVEPMDALRQE